MPAMQRIGEMGRGLAPRLSEQQMSDLRGFSFDRGGNFRTTDRITQGRFRSTRRPGVWDFIRSEHELWKAHSEDERASVINFPLQSGSTIQGGGTLRAVARIEANQPLFLRNPRLGRRGRR